MTASQTLAPTRPIESPNEAQDVVAHLSAVMDELIATVEEETRLVRAGRLRDAGRLQQAKGDLTRLYVSDVLRLRASQRLLTKAVPAVIAALTRRHDTFRALLQINLTVLATAHAVAEGIIRGVSNEIQRKASLQTYGASGRANVPARKSGAPLAVSRSL
jgi:hypothetical protein